MDTMCTCKHAQLYRSASAAGGPQPATRSTPLPTVTDGHRQPYDLNSSMITASTQMTSRPVSHASTLLRRLRQLWLIATKSELASLGSRAHCGSSVGGVTVRPSKVVRDLNVLLNPELTMKQVARSCFFQTATAMLRPRHGHAAGR